MWILLSEMSAKLSCFHTDCLDDLQMIVEDTGTSLQESNSRLAEIQTGKCVDNTSSINTL